ncbi:PREDICTED: uncharacterized protein LOC109242052 [Nicotiana attenuata]|uniref:Uncharacterized protein n=1 Tax=Nicotiana attenuata TaxID=49451 RepID=A0A314L4H7_NICAT|nr:PREDICTED: uncharacterized protein LOC109242052 [Nicotiana attenuata]OIT36442.1 hypothetical protein A4A49_10141 [Nicotiana attenuata]
MNTPPPVLKKPKIETEEDKANGIEEENKKEQEEALVALIEHRTKEVEHLRQRLSYYTSQFDQAEKRLEETQLKLARLRGRENIATSTSSRGIGKSPVTAKKRSPSPIQINEGSSLSLSETKPQPSQDSNTPFRKSPAPDRKVASPFLKSEYTSRSVPQAKPPLVIPDVKPRVSQPLKMLESGPKISSGSDPQAGGSGFAHGTSMARLKEDKSQRTPEKEASEIQPRTKRKFEQKEHKELIPLIGSCSSASMIRCQTSCVISSQHKRKMRTIISSPTNNELFASSALDGIINLWQIHGRGSTANRLSSTDCLSSKHRRWPEDVAWHPEGNSLFSVYSADGGDSQISILNLKGKEKTRVSFLVEKPHVKGIINNIMFMPWEDVYFVTGGSDHAAVLWSNVDGENSWKPKALHRSLHSSAVMGVAGLQHKKVVMSAGADKRIIGFDLLAQRAEYKHQIENKCMSVLPNPCDFNLFMVQTGTIERQLRLFDFRLRQTEVQAFGWKQESSDSQSALINQAWSPDGLYITSGSVDPVIHIFDIRYNSHKPSQSIKAHQKRVFKAVWHHAIPLLISISSDLNIGLHKII